MLGLPERRVEHEHDRVTLTRKGRPAAVLISPED